LKSFWTEYDSKVSETISFHEYHLVDVGFTSISFDRMKAYHKN
jgi:hypothetical protein